MRDSQAMTPDARRIALAAILASDLEPDAKLDAIDELGPVVPPSSRVVPRRPTASSTPRADTRAQRSRPEDYRQKQAATARARRAASSRVVPPSSTTVVQPRASDLQISSDLGSGSGSPSPSPVASLPAMVAPPLDDGGTTLSPPAPPPKPKRGTVADRQARGTRCPTAGHADAPTFLDRQGLPALSSPQGALVAAMLDSHGAKGTVSLDWKAHWRMWQRNEPTFLRGAPPLVGPYRDPSAPPRAIDPAEIPGTPEYLAASSAHSRRCWARDDADPRNLPGGDKWRLRQHLGLHLVPPIPMPATHEEQLAVLDQLAAGMGRP